MRKESRCFECWWAIVLAIIVILTYVYLSTVSVDSLDNGQVNESYNPFQRQHGDVINGVELGVKLRNTPSHARTDSTTTDRGKVLPETRVTETIVVIRQLIGEINRNETVLNNDTFPSFELVIVVQVHRRIKYLNMLVESLRDAKHIDTVLLVVSLDYYDKELLLAVEKIDFCKVIITLIMVWDFTCLIITKHLTSP